MVSLSMAKLGFGLLPDISSCLLDLFLRAVASPANRKHGFMVGCDFRVIYLRRSANNSTKVNIVFIMN